MIDKEYEIYNRLVDYLKSLTITVEEVETQKYPNLTFSATYTNTPSQYPFVSIEQIENSNNQRASDCCNIENAVDVAFEINIYTKDTTQKIQAKEIANDIDNFMLELGIDRTSCVPVPTNDGVSYRINMRYNAVIGKDCIVYRR